MPVSFVKPSENSSTVELVFRIQPPRPNSRIVPATVLIDILDGAQRAIHLLGLLNEGIEINERARISAEIEAKYALNCEAPSAGSYVLSSIVGQEGDLLREDSPAYKVVANFLELSGAILAKDIERLRRVVADRLMRSRILEAFRVMVPKPGSGISLELTGPKRPPLHFDEQLQPVIKALLKRAESVQEVRTVTGILEKVDFGARKVTLIYPVTQRELDCFYDEAIEESLLDQRRGLIQVTGQVVVDEENHPKKIVQVEAINGLDLTAFEVVEIAHGRGKLRFSVPQTFVPKLSEDMQLLCLEVPDLNLDIHAETRDQLAAELQAHLEMLWEEYAKADDGELTPSAKLLKERLREALEEVTNG
jgi:hypothetical protein